VARAALSEVERGLEAMGWQTADGRRVTREPPFGASVVVWRPAADGVEWLVLHRAHHGADYEGDWAWGPPSGARLPGEAVDACARRELWEEAGLELEVRRTSCGTSEWAVYEAEAPAHAAVALSAEHDAFRWLPLDEAAAACLPAQVADGLRAIAAAVTP
jgi:8-oxo-dGTP pyrophosphatase MutT (NUDIX family)